MVHKLKFVSEFHRAVGHALTRWQYVETGLYILSHCLMGTKHQHSSTVFFHIESARSKLSLTDKLCKLELSQDAYQRHWRPLKKDINAANDVRNGLAHFDVAFLDPDEIKNTGQTTAYPIMLCPNSHDETASPDGRSKALFVETLQKTAVEFHELTQRLLEFVPAHIPDWQLRTKSLPQETQQILASIGSANPPSKRKPPAK